MTSMILSIAPQVHSVKEYFRHKGFWPDQKNKKYHSLCPIKTEILISEGNSYFLDYCSEISGPKYVPFRCYEQKQVTYFHKSVVTKPKVHTVSSMGQCYTYFFCV